MHLLVQTSLDTGHRENENVHTSRWSWNIFWVLRFMGILIPIWLVKLHFIFIKIMVALYSSYLKTSKATLSSSFCTVYCQRYSDFKTFGDWWRPSWISPQKRMKKMETVFIQSFSVNTCDKNTNIILRLSVTGGSHLEFPHEKVDEKKGNIFIPVL